VCDIQLFSGKRPTAKLVGWLTLLGILGVFINQLFFILAVSYSGSILPSIMQVWPFSSTKKGRHRNTDTKINAFFSRAFD
jgi:drug/metabolite transporter (DMT)-like permease